MASSPQELGQQLLDILNHRFGDHRINDALAAEKAIALVEAHPTGIDVSVIDAQCTHTSLTLVCARGYPYARLIKMLIDYPGVDLNQRIPGSYMSNKEKTALQCACDVPINDGLQLLMRDRLCNLYMGEELIVKNTVLADYYRFHCVLASMRDLGNSEKSHMHVILSLRVDLMRSISETNAYRNSFVRRDNDTPLNRLVDIDHYLARPLSAVVQFRDTLKHFSPGNELCSSHLFILVSMTQQDYYFIRWNYLGSFFNVARKLPIELQCILCNMAYNIKGFIVHGIDEMVTFMKINNMF
jgi:hypothetical protein